MVNDSSFLYKETAMTMHKTNQRNRRRTWIASKVIKTVKRPNWTQVKAEIQSIEQQLQLKGIDEIRTRIQEVQHLLKEAEKQIEQIQETLPQKTADKRYLFRKAKQC